MKTIFNREIELEKHWPREGVIEFRDVSVKYRPNLKPVIKGLSFNVKLREKIGIEGRTGAEKSTITLTFLRILELMQGQILIYGINIAKSVSPRTEVGSNNHSSRNPHFFEGTLRMTVDTLKQCKNKQIIETLYKCNLN